MNRILLLLLLLALPIFVHAQNDRTYFDKNWKPTEKEEASYYRVSQKQGELYQIGDYFMNGKQQFSAMSHTPNEPFELEGNAVWYFENGNKQREAAFVGNKLSGKSIRYYSNGAKMEEGTYSENVPNGSFFQYFPSGEIQKQATYKNAKEDGLYLVYEAPNVKKMELHFTDGVANGPYVEFRKGKPQSRGNAKMGFLDGECLTYNYYGELLSKATFKNRKLNGTYTEYSNGSQIRAKGEFEDGVAKSFEMQGRQTNGSSFSSKMTLKKGVERWQVFRDGKRIAETQYEKGKAVGLWNLYTWDGSQLFETRDYTNADCRDDYLQESKGFEIFFIVSGRFSNDFLPEQRCEGVVVNSVFKKRREFDELHPVYHYRESEKSPAAPTGEGPKLSYKTEKVEKDGTDGYKISSSATLLKDFDYREPANAAEFSKKNDCKPFGPDFPQTTVCKRNVNGFDFSVYLSENVQELQKLKAKLSPSDNEIQFFYQKFEQRLYKAGEKPGNRLMLFNVPQVVKEAMNAKIVDYLVAVEALESHIFETASFSGTSCADALEKELKR